MSVVLERPAQGAPARRRTASRLSAGLVLAVGVLAVVLFLSITLGARGVDLGTIWAAFASYDPDSAAHTVIRELRVPRTILGLAVGASLGLGGAILQGATRNPLADPGIMGVNAGAAAFIVTGILVFGTMSLSTYVWLGFVGAGVATALVYAVASIGREGATPVKLALAGAAISAALYSVTTGVVLSDLGALNELRFWQVGSLAGRYWDVVAQAVPFMAVAVVVALACGRLLNGLALGDDLATALGQRVRLTRTVLFVTVAVLCGAATAACGPIVFIGLIVPHVARAICGPDYRWIMAYTAVLAPIVLLLADILGRIVTSPAELQVGVVLGIAGAPAFIALVRFRNLAEL